MGVCGGCGGCRVTEKYKRGRVEYDGVRELG